jgi:hypothetical protein
MGKGQSGTGKGFIVKPLSQEMVKDARFGLADSGCFRPQCFLAHQIDEERAADEPQAQFVKLTWSNQSPAPSSVLILIEPRLTSFWSDLSNDELGLEPIFQSLPPARYWSN